MIGDRIKNLRKAKRILLSELADKAGVAKSYLSTIERNIHTNPSIPFLEKIASCIRCFYRSNDSRHSEY